MTATFERRDTSLPPDPIEALGTEFADDPTKRAQWAAFQARAGGEPSELSVVVETVRKFVEPVLLATGRGKPFDRVWPAGGPWQK